MNPATASLPQTAARPATDWRLAIAEPRRRAIRAWLWTIAAFTLLVLIIGGVTRLTLSGLSIVDWDPIMGVIPPLNEAQWQAAFDRYRQFPQYLQLMPDMTLAQFKGIFFWEYIHRLAARTIGIVFLVPFALFAARRWLTRPLAIRALGLFALGGLQGLMGWLMVKSGLVDRPSVSHFRLAAHLSLAFIIFGAAVWLARELRTPSVQTTTSPATHRTLRRGLAMVGVLLGLQIVWGAFTAGLKAGLYFNTFPLMGGRLFPPGFFAAQPALANLVNNPIAVQWTHRLIGTLLALTALGAFIQTRRANADPLAQRIMAAFAGLTIVQYALGILTLILVIPIPLAVTHQAMAMVLFGTWIIAVHHVRNVRVVSATT